MTEEQTSQATPIKKPNWAQRLILKRALKKTKKVIQEVKKKGRKLKASRLELEKAILDFTDMLIIERDDGTEVNKKTIINIPNEELEEILEQSLNELEKMV